ncbi:MAG: cysteine methyltransferase, partial [Planctomycetales bacterium]|nr:cysteine methyltransferase [Planctomycetales bacterium]
MLWRMVRQVPAGRVTTYGRLAKALGDPVAARWVGHVLLHHDHQPAC